MPEEGSLHYARHIDPDITVITSVLILSFSPLLMTKIPRRSEFRLLNSELCRNDKTDILQELA